MGESAFQLKEQVVLLTVLVKTVEEKKEELEGRRGSIAEGRVTKWIKKLRPEGSISPLAFQYRQHQEDRRHLSSM